MYYYHSNCFLSLFPMKTDYILNKTEAALIFFPHMTSIGVLKPFSLEDGFNS